MIEQGTIDVCRVHVAVTQIRETKIRLREINTEQVGPLKRGMSHFAMKFGHRAIRVIQIGSFKLSPGGLAMPQLGSLQTSIREVGPFHMAIVQQSFGEIRFLALDPQHRRAGQVRPAKTTVLAIRRR